MPTAGIGDGHDRAMKRDEALRSLSRDHHQALVVAQRLAAGRRRRAAAAEFAEFFEGKGQLHFGIEEQVLLPRWAELGSVDADGGRPARGRAPLDPDARASSSAAAPTLEAAHALGEELDAHVRFEERELFPAIEARPRRRRARDPRHGGRRGRGGSRLGARCGLLAREQLQRVRQRLGDRRLRPGRCCAGCRGS